MQIYHALGVVVVPRDRSRIAKECLEQVRERPRTGKISGYERVPKLVPSQLDGRQRTQYWLSEYRGLGPADFR
jgi:hypothetical protein